MHNLTYYNKEEEMLENRIKSPKNYFTSTISQLLYYHFTFRTSLHSFIWLQREWKLYAMMKKKEKEEEKNLKGDGDYIIFIFVNVLPLNFEVKAFCEFSFFCKYIFQTSENIT